MARRIDEPVRVALRPGGAEPAAFTWEGRRYAVERVEACWKEVGPWWDGPAPRTSGGAGTLGEHTFFRVTARHHVRAAGAPLSPPAGVYELRFDHSGERWWLHEVID
jgi:hypothetical protein